jgi:F-type H+-transporting ATPase subunit b
MSLLANVNALATAFVQSEFDTDDKGVTSAHPIFPERQELIYGGLASIIVIGLLVWKGWPLAKKAMVARTQRIQDQLDAARVAKEDAEAEAASIRQALGDVEAERARLMAEAEAQAAALLVDGRARIEQEIAELEARAAADIEAAQARSFDELRAEIAHYAAAAADQVVEQMLDEVIQQELIEAYISEVGASR